MIDSIYLQITVELFFGFVGLLISVRIVGNRQVQQITPFDFVSAIVLGELLGNGVYDGDVTIVEMLYGIGLWTLLLITVEKITQKSQKIRNVIQGTPKLIIVDGIIQYGL